VERLDTEHKLDYGTPSPLLRYLILLSTELGTLGLPLIIVSLSSFKFGLIQTIDKSYERRQTRLDTQDRIKCRAFLETVL
jgi:hypothetical protein